MMQPKSRIENNSFIEDNRFFCEQRHVFERPGFARFPTSGDSERIRIVPRLQGGHLERRSHVVSSKTTTKLL